MIKFLDGPASGVVLQLRRAPKFLRVVIDANDGATDALDQLDDRPKFSERIFAYKLFSYEGPIHLLRCPRSKSGWYHMGSYKLHAEQPDDATLRDSSAWRDWCTGQVDHDKESSNGSEG